MNLGFRKLVWSELHPDPEGDQDEKPCENAKYRDVGTLEAAFRIIVMMVILFCKIQEDCSGWLMNGLPEIITSE